MTRLVKMYMDESLFELVESRRMRTARSDFCKLLIAEALAARAVASGSAHPTYQISDQNFGPDVMFHGIETESLAITQSTIKKEAEEKVVEIKDIV